MVFINNVYMNVTRSNENIVLMLNIKIMYESCKLEIDKMYSEVEL